jgi:cardiolipin synthase
MTKKITLPTLVTLLRIILVPFIVWAIVAHQWSVAFWLFLLAAVTDTVDGNLARFMGEQTFLGACLDPIADKFLLLSCFLALSLVHSPFIFIPTWFFILVLIKELLLVVGAIMLFLTRGEFEVKPTLLGKITTAVQMAFIVWFFSCSMFHWLPVKTFYGILVLIVVLTLSSLFQYAMAGLRFFFRFLR